MREDDLGPLVTRVVDFAWRGHSMRLGLSQSLFSSADVDRGSRLLLKHLAAERSHLPPRPRALDLGSGCGVLGIALALDGAQVVFRDRDALAVAFSGHNCRENGVQPLALEGGLDLPGLPGTPFDLVVSNLPAKAGEGAHAAMMAGIRRCLAPDGLAALVVVAALEERIAASGALGGLNLEVAERAREHTVFLARPSATPAPSPPPDPLTPYYRETSWFRTAGTDYRIEALYDLPEFDTQSHGTRLAMEGLLTLGHRLDRHGPVLVWNPGQGHVPVWLARRAAANALPEVTVAGRDLLSLLGTARNAGGAVRRVVHTWHPGDAGGGWGTMVVFPDHDPAARWEERLPDIVADALVTGGHLVLSHTSTFVGRFLHAARGYRELWSRKMAGSRCVVLRRV